MKKIILLTIACFSIVLLLASFAKPSTVNLKVQVINKDCKSPVANAKIFVYKLNNAEKKIFIGTTDDSGFSKLNLPAKGRYMLIIQHCDFSKHKFEIDASRRNGNELVMQVGLQKMASIQLPELERSISITVKERLADGSLQPVTNATVYTPDWWKETDANGHVSGKYYMFCGETVTIWAEAKGFKTKGLTFTIPEGNLKDEIEFIIERERE
jgi:hypothetical protein